MLTVSSRFLQAPTRPATLSTTVTLTTPGGASQVLPFAAGTVNVDRTQRIRRTAPLTVKGGSSLYDLLRTPGAQVRVDHGFSFGGTAEETVPVITGPLSTSSLTVGDGLVGFSVADRWQDLAAQEYLIPYTPAATATRVAVITAAVRDAFPGITITNTASDAGVIGTAQAWTSRADMVASLATDAGIEAYFAPDGSFVMRDLPQITDLPVWLIKTGPGGTLKTLTRTRPLDKLFNTVILTPATFDAAQAWSQVVAQITDLSNARHPSKIGVRPYRYQSPTLLTAAQAMTVAQQLLTKVQGTTETFAVEAMGMAALEGGDVVRITAFDDQGNATAIVNHFMQQLALDLVAGSMSGNTQSSSEVAA